MSVWTLRRLTRLDTHDGGAFLKVVRDDDEIEESFRLQLEMNR